MLPLRIWVRLIFRFHANFFYKHLYWLQILRKYLLHRVQNVLERKYSLNKLESHNAYNEVRIVLWGALYILDSPRWIGIVQLAQHYGLSIYRRNVLVQSLYTDVYGKHYST